MGCFFLKKRLTSQNPFSSRRFLIVYSNVREFWKRIWSFFQKIISKIWFGAPDFRQFRIIVSIQKTIFNISGSTLKRNVKNWINIVLCLLAFPKWNKHLITWKNSICFFIEIFVFCLWFGRKLIGFKLKKLFSILLYSRFTNKGSRFFSKEIETIFLFGKSWAKLFLFFFINPSWLDFLFWLKNVCFPIFWPLKFKDAIIDCFPFFLVNLPGTNDWFSSKNSLFIFGSFIVLSRLSFLQNYQIVNNLPAKWNKLIHWWLTSRFWS